MLTSVHTCSAKLSGYPRKRCVVCQQFPGSPLVQDFGCASYHLSWHIALNRSDYRDSHCNLFNMISQDPMSHPVKTQGLPLMMHYILYWSCGGIREGKGIWLHSWQRQGALLRQMESNMETGAERQTREAIKLDMIGIETCSSTMYLAHPLPT